MHQLGGFSMIIPNDLTMLVLKLILKKVTISGLEINFEKVTISGLEID
jgi:hypothetical protein